MWSPGPEILTVAEMSEVDRLTVASGVPSLTLMENAGRQVANEIAKRWSNRRTTVLCGPGNNGGDGYVVARHLQARGWPVEIIVFTDPASLKDDAAEMVKQWRGPTRRFDPKEPVHGELFVDAAFGAGLTRALVPDLSQLFEDIGMADVPVVAVDVPSGLSGDEGRFLGDTQPWNATLTVTFFRKKPAHVLYPGRGACGEVVLVDIGIPDGMIHALNEHEQREAGRQRPECVENNDPPPPPPLDPTTHKYQRGHCLVVSGSAAATGAARLAARAALRVGAGLVTVAGPRDALPELGASLTAIMVREASDAAALSAMLQDKRINAVVIGPGNGVGKATQEKVAAALASSAGVVLDADALTSFAGEPTTLFRQLNERAVLTPHEGEFEKLFPGLLAKSANRIEAARAAAERARAVVLLKGPDTVIAQPNGDAAVNTNAPSHLATAGAGDVLAGTIAGLKAQGLRAFDAARTGAFLHGACGRITGAGLIAEDLPERLPQAAKLLRTRRSPGL